MDTNKKSFKHRLLDNYGINSLLILSFFIVIAIGTILLCLPIAHTPTTSAGFIDHLFTATSATCVTGLLTVPMYTDYTLFGQIVVLIMIQIGGLGLMTFISVALLFINNKLELKEQLLLKDALNKMDLHDIKSYIYGIVKFTITFEALGALILYSQFRNDYVFMEAIWQAVFTSISAFCNAGIECIGSTSLMPYNTNPIVLMTVATLIVSGGLGFGVWFDFKAKLGLMHKAKEKFRFFHSKMAIHTKIVVYMTTSLLIFGTFFIFFIETNNALADMSLGDKIWNAIFNSATLRTAGFYSMDYSIIHRITKILMIVLMFIGGSPGGTAGGIKTTTFFLLIYMLYCELKQYKHMHIFHRHVGKANFIKAYTIFMFYLMSVLVAHMVLVCSENFDALDLMFECVSAIATVGLSTGLTAGLTVVGKVVIILLMFIGRVGPITIAYQFGSKRPETYLRYPKVDIIVG